MKQPKAKVTALITLVGLCFTNSIAHAQGDGKNMVKANLSAFALKGYSVQYERKLSHRFTAALNYSSIPFGTIAFQSTFERYTEGTDINLGKLQLGTSIFTPEVRLYTGKQGAYHGFYLAPYARISNYKMEVPVAFNSALMERTALFTGTINNTTGGLMLGSQWSLSKKIYLDWWIVGASIGTAKGNLVATTPLNPAEQQELRNQLENIDIPFTKIQYEVNSTGATVTTSGAMAGARGLGINLGFRF